MQVSALHIIKHEVKVFLILKCVCHINYEGAIKFAEQIKFEKCSPTLVEIIGYSLGHLLQGIYFSIRLVHHFLNPTKATSSNQLFEFEISLLNFQSGHRHNLSGIALKLIVSQFKLFWEL